MSWAVKKLEIAMTKLDLLRRNSRTCRAFVSMRSYLRPPLCWPNLPIWWNRDVDAKTRTFFIDPSKTSDGAYRTGSELETSFLYPT
jgi:hypothetical protein